MRMSARIVASVALLGLACPILGATHYVSPSGGHTPPFTNWPSAATNIQAAIDAARGGDTVLVTNGVYNVGGRSLFDVSNRVAVTEALTVRGINGPEATVIEGYRPPYSSNGEGAVRCAYLSGGAVLTGFTLANGGTVYVPWWIEDSSGGGLWCASTSEVVSNCVLTGNEAHFYGGGAFRGTLIDCTLTGNRTYESRGGGAYGSTLNDCTLTRNSASEGGGAYRSTLNNSALASNFGYWGGGACESTLSNCTLTANSAEDGGGVYDCTINNSTLTGNFGSWRGGGAYESTLTNCTLTENQADSRGGGACDSTLINSIVYYNQASQNPNCSSGSVSHTCTTPLPFGFGNITNAPQFVDLSTTNLRLKSTSPCIDVGTNLAWMARAVDFDGLPRVINGTVDMGAYEWPNMSISSITPPSTPSEGIVITWASFSNAEYAVYGSSNLVQGYDIPLQDAIAAHPPENVFTDAVSGVEMRGYAVEYTP